MTTPEQIAAWIAEYDRQGWHRTGSRTDARSARWLAAAASQAGALVEMTSFPLTRLIHRSSSLLVEDFPISGMPLFDCGLPPSAGVAGSLGKLGSRADIGVVEHDSGISPAAVEQARRDGDHRAMVVLGPGGAAGLAPRNAPYADRPFGPPVIQVSSHHTARIYRGIDSGSRGMVRMDAHRQAGRALNVAARLDAEAGRAPRVVVLTPRSGWWHCAAERGGGIASWLYAINALARADFDKRRLVSFVATSGHELGFLGLRHYLDAGRLPDDVVWLHLGANIGARNGELRVAASDADLASVALAVLSTRHGAPAAGLAAAAVGEGSQLRARGQRYISLVGSNSKFHLLSDKYPENVDVPALTSVCAAVAGLVEELVS